MNTLRIAWRNLWRVPRRTVLTVAAVSLGVTAIVFLASYRESAYGQMIRTITDQLVGHVQVHGKGYQETPELATVVKEPRLVEAQLAQALPGAVAERRVIGAALAGAADSSAGVVVMGLQDGQGASLLTVTSGRALGKVAAHEVVLGVDLAQQLDVKPGAELVLLGQAADGSTANDRYQVVGIGDMGSSDLNATAVFLHLEDAQEFFGLGDAVHLVVLHLPTDSEDVSAQLAAARGALDLTSLEALSWNEMLPELRKTVDSKRSGGKAMDVVVFFLVALGVLNVMTMATFERTREFGVMMSIGTRPSGILRLVLTEAALQGLLGLAVGVALAVALVVGVGTLDMSSLTKSDMLGVRMPQVLFLKVQWGSIAWAGVVTLTTMLLAGLLPAWRASRLQPATAVRES
jgi:putative ABC transport system permease protein